MKFTTLKKLLDTNKVQYEVLQNNEVLHFTLCEMKIKIFKTDRKINSYSLKADETYYETTLKGCIEMVKSLL